MSHEPGERSVQKLGHILLTGGKNGRAAELFAQGLVDSYPSAMASGRSHVWATAAHSIIDLFATAPALQLVERVKLDLDIHADNHPSRGQVR